MEENFEFKETIFNSLIEKIKPVFEEEKELEFLNRSYNIFEVLNIERKEVGLHSYFIYDLLNPNSVHEKSPIFLKFFLKEVLGYNVEQLENFDPIDYDIQREVDTGDGRIDFIINDLKNNMAHIIEMKIDADDQEKQLIRYDKYAKKVYKDHYNLYYLTLDGREASEQSSESIEYKQISFKYHIVTWLKEVLKRLNNLSNFKLFAEQYLKTIKNITNSFENNDIKEKYVECLSNDEDIIKYAEYLVKQGEIIKDKVLDTLNNEIYNELIKNISVEMKLAERYKEDRDYVSIYIKQIGNLKNIRFGVAVDKEKMYFYIGACKGIGNDVCFEEKTIAKELYVNCFTNMKGLRKNPNNPYYYEYFYTFEKDEDFILSNKEEYNKLKNYILIFMKEKINQLIKCSKGDE